MDFRFRGNDIYRMLHSNDYIYCDLCGKQNICKPKMSHYLK